MLRRCSIRTKMFAGLGLLASAVLLLAFSGFWGLYGYRGLANSVSDASREIELANALHRKSVKLQSCNPQAIRDTGFRLIGGSGPSDSRAFATAPFGVALESLGTSLETYNRELELALPSRGFLPDLKERRQSLESVEGNFQIVRGLSVHLQDDPHDTTLTDALGELVAMAEQHANGIQTSMAEFSQQVKGQYRARIALAWFFLVAALTLIVLLLWLFWTSMIQPFRTLLEGSRMVAKESAFGHRITLGTGDELEELATAMNDMSSKFLMEFKHGDRLRKNLQKEVRDRTREVIRNEQLASVGFLAAGVAHEINNPLTTIAWGAESLEGMVADLGADDDEETRVQSKEMLLTTLKQIQSEAFRCKGITDRLLDFSRMSEIRRANTDLAAMVDDVVDLVSKVGEYRCKSIRTHHNGPVMAEVNSHQIRQVVLNLISNALESVESDGAVDVYVLAENNTAKIVVQDDGCGMSEEVMTHLFEPFFTRRKSGQGTGLGLSITCRIVSQHGGSLVPKSDGEGKGSVLEVTLPLKAESNDSIDPLAATTEDRLLAA